VDSNDYFLTKTVFGKRGGQLKEFGGCLRLQWSNPEGVEQSSSPVFGISRANGPVGRLRNWDGVLRLKWSKPEAWIIHELTKDWIVQASAPAAWAWCSDLVKIGNQGAVHSVY
jgi:hypothetical protein